MTLVIFQLMAQPKQRSSTSNSNSSSSSRLPTMHALYSRRAAHCSAHIDPQGTGRAGRHNKTVCCCVCVGLCCSTMTMMMLMVYVPSTSTSAGFACLSNPCVYGVCIDDLNSTYSCYCIDGYTGVQCQTNWDECWSNPCLNGGVCIDGVASYNCTCPEGFLGLNCEENYNECQSNPCQNGGLCHDKDNAFYCSCAQGYEGEYCEIDVAVCDTGDRCHNGAACSEGPGLEFYCRCTEGYEGRLCDEEINECASAPCQNGAICIDKFASYVCACPMGYSGTNCDEEIMFCASSPCANQALCLMEEEQPTCYCVPDFHGERCEMQYDECQLGPEPRCLNGGTCLDGVDEHFCSCAPNFSGENCECFILQDSDGQIELDCNYTMPERNDTQETTADYFTTTTEPVDGSTSGIEDGASSIPWFSTEYSFPASTIPNENRSETTDSPGEAVTSGIDDRWTTPFFQTTRSTGGTSIRPSAFTTQTGDERETTVTVGSAGVTLPDTDTTTIVTIMTTINGTLIGPDGGPETPTILPADGSTLDTTTPASGASFTPITKPSHTTSFTTPEHPDSVSGRPTTITPELSSFFTETPSNKTVASAGTTAFPAVTVSGSFEDDSTTLRPSFTSLAPDDGMGTLATTTTRSPDVIQECSDTVCANGGTCSMTTNGVRCHCDFRYGGHFCDVPVSIQHAAFSKDSYVRHSIYRRRNESRTNEQNDQSVSAMVGRLMAITVRFKAKLTSREGLIFLATTEGDQGNHYVALFLQRGLLQFQFSCGLQTMLLSEIDGSVNNGFELNIKVQLNFNDRLSHCNASLHVNETLAMSGEQPTWLINSPPMSTDQTAALASIRQSWLHLGGRPIKTMYTLSHNISRYHGFTGCLYELEINNNHVAIFDNAEDAYKIYECTSLACLSSPCRNGAICVEDQTTDGRSGPNPGVGTEQGPWSCKCAFGYMGKTCERSICDNNPCQYGGTCVTFPETGYLCLCPYGKHGHLCEHDLDILQPSFFGSIKGISSYVTYPISFPLEDRFEFSFKIIPTTTSQISLLAFIGQPGDHNELGDHFSVSFIQGFILVTWNLGSGPRRIFTQQPIQVQPTRPTTIQVGRNGRTAWLSIDGKVNISGNAPGSSRKLNVAPQLFIGGHEAVNFSSLPHDLPLHSGFQGCLFDIRLIAGPVHIPLQHIGGMRGRSVGQCGTKECHRHACQNNGACLQHGSTFTCICQEDWHGLLCSQKLNPCDESLNKCAPDAGAQCFPLVSGGYECDCSFGRVGKRCEIPLKYLSDVSFSGRRSFVALRWPASARLAADSDAFLRENEVPRYERIVQHSHIIPHNHSILLKSIRELDKINDVLRVFPATGNDTEGYGHALQARSEDYRQLKLRQLVLELQVRPLAEKGIIMFIRTFDSNANVQGFISLSLQGGVIEYRVSSGRFQATVVRSNHVLAIGEWHQVRIVKYGKRMTLWVEGKSSSGVGTVREEYISLSSELYLGGLPDLSMLPIDALSGYPVPFRGCIRNVNLNGSRVLLNDSTIIASRNIQDCDGTPCGGELCARGGICWLDEHSQPRCKCPEFSKGPNCEIQESCERVPCRNNGLCLASGRCSCGVGWTGHYCEIATSKYSSLGFGDQSYILIPSQKIKMKDKRNHDHGGSTMGNRSALELHLSFNLSTLNDGVLVWTTDANGGYFGLGIRNGFIVVTSNMLDQDEYEAGANETTTTPAEPWKAYVADGDWHNVLLETKANVLHISVDGYELPGGLKIANLPSDSAPHNPQALPEEITYLGGFPQENVHNRTRGAFSTSFRGCIQQIILGTNDLLDYTAYEGANIERCVL
ncbi:protein eyes shut [Anopheles aquasalis]|uniref:protein eyes shut n=1 Tax=Anopheles aquasalis TaxID=42839 RepID=UPI00215B36B6|nr:protein eyes shut [Anopheles aquasalis]